MPDTTSGGIDLSGLQQFIPGIIDLINGARGQGTNRGNTAADLADPYRKYRGEASDQLHTLISDPSSIEKDPGFQYGLDHALDAGNRSSGALGQGNSGNNILQQSDIGQRYATTAYNTKFNQLSSLALGSPTAAANAYIKGTEANDATLGQGVGDLTKLLSGPGGAAIISALSKLPGGQELLKLINPGGGPGPAVDANGNPDPTGQNPPGGVDVNPDNPPIGSGGEEFTVGGDTSIDNWDLMGGGTDQFTDVWDLIGNGGDQFTDVWDLLGGG